MREIASREIPVDMDDTADQCTVSGELRAVKRAYAFFWNATKGTKYMSWVQFAKENPDEIKTFFDDVIFDGDVENGDPDEDIPDVDDLLGITDTPTDDENDFWNWYTGNQN